MTPEELAGRQRDDGSWGDQGTARARIVTTIFAARSLQEGGHGDQPCLGPALDFLTATAVVDGGGSIGGTRETVLSCYTGMLARLFVRAGRHQEARPLLEWIVAHQPVVFGDVVYHRPAGPGWGDYLLHKYGGCMAASTTCLLGLVPAVSALATAREAGLAVGGEAHEAALRRLLVDRRLMFGRSGEVMPLAGRTKADPAGTRWLVPAFPLDYVIDLVELIDVARRVGVPLDAMGEAVDLVQSWALPDGGWPMLGKRRLPVAYRPEAPDRRRASPTITRRVEALGLTAAQPGR